MAELPSSGESSEGQQRGQSADQRRSSTSSPAAGTAVPCGRPPRHPPAGLPASGCRDGMRQARAGRHQDPTSARPAGPVAHTTALLPFASCLPGCSPAAGVRRLGADRAHRRPRDGAGPAPRRPAPRSRRSASMSPVPAARSPPGRAFPVPVTMHPPGLPAVEVVVVPAPGTTTAQDTHSALAARRRAVIRAAGTAPARTTTSAEAVWCPT